MFEKKEFKDVHWADNAAKNVLKVFPDEEVYTVASGITPSGIVHVGHFREIITSELVRKALENKGKKTKFIYSWDSYDAFRKVPKNLPSNWSEYLRLPNSMVPDPDNKYKSFAEKYMVEAEKSLEVFNFPIIYQRQHELQSSGMYADGIRNFLRSKESIRLILDSYRDEPLSDNWMPLTVYSEDTGKDTTKIIEYDNEYTLKYVNTETGFENTINFKQTPIVKLSWRLDWPMRWDYFKVTYEPGGKDHSTPGGSYDTGCKIIREVCQREPPVYSFYNHVRMKGMGGKISSSVGDGATTEDVLKVYTPEMVLFLFAGTRPNAEMEISFDLDVIKLYEDFDKFERLYYGLEIESNLKKLETIKRTYELSMVNGREIQKEIPFQPSFRHLVTVCQVNNFDLNKIQSFFSSKIKTSFDELRLTERVQCVKNWIEIYAPEEMKFQLVTNIDKSKLSDDEIKILSEIKSGLQKVEDPKEMFSHFKQICSNYNLEIKDFFPKMYLIFINKDKGPKLGGFMLENKSEFLNLLKDF